MLKFVAGYLYTQLQTTIHKFWVTFYTVKFCIKNKGRGYRRWIIKRSIFHDSSKYRWKEAKGFAVTIFDLKSSTYGSEEYKKLLAKLGPGLEHHYRYNSHHPEFWSLSLDGVEGFLKMGEWNKIEMVIDWRAATRRHKDGNIFKSLELNQKRFGYSDEEKDYLTSIAKLVV
jgi:hypothetical protein